MLLIFNATLCLSLHSHTFRMFNPFFYPNQFEINIWYVTRQKTARNTRITLIWTIFVSVLSFSLALSLCQSEVCVFDLRLWIAGVSQFRSLFLTFWPWCVFFHSCIFSPLAMSHITCALVSAMIRCKSERHFQTEKEKWINKHLPVIIIIPIISSFSDILSLSADLVWLWFGYHIHICKQI